MANGFFGGGDGTEINPYLVEDSHDLNAVRDNLFAHYKQVADIDLEGLNWQPIGGYDEDGEGAEFTGGYDGNNKKILNMLINGTNIQSIGLFSQAYHATFKNIHILNGAIQNVSSPWGDIGLLVGGGRGLTLENCHANGEIISECSSAGGLIGFIGFDWDFSKTYSLYKCSASVDIPSGNMNVGGLIGEANGNNDSGGPINFITECFATGTVSSLDGDTGGLIGTSSYNTIKNCYAIGKASSAYVGGLFGYIWDSVIENSYAAGIVEVIPNGWEESGGIAYDMYNCSFLSCYYDSETTGQPDNGIGIPKTTEQMKQQATFINWDFENIWSIRENETYPYFATRSTGQLQAMPLTSITVVN